MSYICTIKLIKHMETTITDQKEFKFTQECSTTLREFDQLFSDLFNRTWEVLGKEYNLAQLGWSRAYNHRKTALGLCAWNLRTGKKVVYISKTLLSHNLDKAYDFEDTIRHEIAHAIDCEIRKRSNHDYHWKRICREVGADDTRCHEGFLEKPKGKYTLVCPKCDRRTEKYRKPKNRKACGKCCKEFAYGRFDERFELKVVQNY